MKSSIPRLLFSNQVTARQLARNAREEQPDPELIRFRWLVEELRVSRFAQELKAIALVSVKRLEEQWGKARRG